MVTRHYHNNIYQSISITTHSKSEAWQLSAQLSYNLCAIWFQLQTLHEGLLLHQITIINADSHELVITVIYAYSFILQKI